MPRYADRVAAISTTTGTGTLTLGSAVLKHRTFATAFGSGGNTEVYYSIEETDGDWETGIGTFLGASNALQRDTVRASSTGGAKVSFSAGTKTVSVAWLANVAGDFTSPRATDITLALHSASLQSVPVLQTYNASGVAALAVAPSGALTVGTPAAVTLGTNGFVTSAVGAFGDYYIGGNTSGTVTATRIAVKSGQSVILQGGFTTGGPAAEFHDNNNTNIAEVSPAGTSSPSSLTVITRTKGDTRYAAISSLRFKEDVSEADGLAGLFHNLTPCKWTWGGEVPESDERFGTPGVGFIAEDVAPVVPEACRYIRDDEGDRVLQSLDPLALIAVLHAKIADLETRLAAVEGAA